MRKAILLALLIAGFSAAPVLADETSFFTNGFVAQPIGLQATVGSLSALTNDASIFTDGFLAPVGLQFTIDSASALTSGTSFVAPPQQLNAPAMDFLAPPQQFDQSSFLAPTATNTSNEAAANAAQAANGVMDSAAQGDQAHTTNKTGEGPQGETHAASSPTGKQNQGLNLPPCCYGIL